MFGTVSTLDSPIENYYRIPNGEMIVIKRKGDTTLDELDRDTISKETDVPNSLIQMDNPVHQGKSSATWGGSTILAYVHPFMP